MKPRSATLAESCAFLAQRDFKERRFQSVAGRFGNRPFLTSLPFSQVFSEEFLQFGRPNYNERVAFDAQKLLVAKFCQRTRQRFAGRAEFRRKHAFRSVEFDLNWRCANRTRALF